MRSVVCALAVVLALGTVPQAAHAGDEGLTAQLERPRTLTGRDVDVTGRTTPRSGVRLEELRGERWVTRDRSRADRYGRYALRAAALAVGTFTYRVASDGATSDELVLTVRGRGKDTTWRTRYDRLYRWDPCQVITYRVNARQAPASWEHDVAGAVRRVARQSGLRFRYLGQTGVMPQPGTTNPAGVDLVIAYARKRDTRYLRGRSQDSLGVSDTARLLVPTAAGQERALGNGRVIVNVSWQTYMPRGFGSGYASDDGTFRMGTRGRLLMHEIGHVVGLGHVAQHGRSVRDQVMYPFILDRLAAWGAGDATGFSRVGADAGCFAPPPADARARAVVVRRSSPVS